MRVERARYSSVRADFGFGGFETNGHGEGHDRSESDAPGKLNSRKPRWRPERWVLISGGIWMEKCPNVVMQSAKDCDY